ncbi:HpcH/HpaI aldolase family protein [Larsenimonas rhizosphaerae]|uniref:Aldolase/citrate lyase family protein n=1 Tax=Larsenimonas rhizosphaerae TaxID=2944682 RepID=A0AA41ZM86_9GAMM|nr:aldolase/citrate lyase family protein [Larsenimonas rhizosphaerae]MCX2524771.1 aldolase/citrate lyase family protein [Larsenimonas rhizosphaerae]
MLSENRLRQALKAGRSVFGVLASLPTAASIELIGDAGFDFVVIDTEHVLINPETIEHMIRTAERYRMTPLVRVPDADPKRMLRLLDGGAQGIVIPQVESPETVRQAVQACRYAPEGNRSLNAGRPGAFGRDALSTYVAHANRHIMVVAMIETVAGVAAARDIAETPGLDLVLEGAADLSQSLGISWDTGHPRVLAALEHTARTCLDSGVPYAAFLRHEDAGAYWRARGVTTFMLGDERGIAFRALRRALEQAHTDTGARS